MSHVRAVEPDADLPLALKETSFFVEVSIGCSVALSVMPFVRSIGCGGRVRLKFRVAQSRRFCARDRKVAMVHAPGVQLAGCLAVDSFPDANAAEKVTI
jgi:hypothetical protein